MRQLNSFVRIFALLIALLTLSAMSGCPRPSDNGQEGGGIGGGTGGGMNGGSGAGGGGY